MGMLAYAHFLTPPQVSPSCFCRLSFPTLFAQQSSLLGTETHIREHEKHREYILKQ